MSLIEKMRSSTDSASTRFIIGMVVLMFVVVGGGRSARGGGCSGGMAATVHVSLLLDLISAIIAYIIFISQNVVTALQVRPLPPARSVRRSNPAPWPLSFATYVFF